MNWSGGTACPSVEPCSIKTVSELTRGYCQPRRGALFNKVIYIFFGSLPEYFIPRLCIKISENVSLKTEHLEILKIFVYLYQDISSSLPNLSIEKKAVSSTLSWRCCWCCSISPPSWRELPPPQGRTNFACTGRPWSWATSSIGRRWTTWSEPGSKQAPPGGARHLSSRNLTVSSGIYWEILPNRILYQKHKNIET